MRDQDKALIARARQALSPSAGDEARVFAAVEGRLFGLPASGASGDAAPGAGSAAGAASKPLARVWLHLPNWSWAAKATLGAAFFLGAGAGIALRSASHAPSLPPRPASISAAVSSGRSDPTPASPAPEPPTLIETAPEAAPSQLSKPRKRARPRVETPAPAQPAAESLRPELDALQRAEQALREQQPARALDVLQECERRVGAGRMREERQALATVARCAIAGAPRPSLVAAFIDGYPASAYSERVRRSCAGSD